jgi:hypothetical protein
MSLPYTPDTPRPANVTVDITGTGTLPVVTGRGVLNSITVKSGKTSSTIWVFDNAATATGATIPSNSANQMVAPGMVQNFGATFQNGLTLLVTGTVILTVNYYLY